MLSQLPVFLNKTKTRRYLLKNHLHSDINITWLYSQSFIKKGNRFKAEVLLQTLLNKLKYIALPIPLLSIAN